MAFNLLSLPSLTLNRVLDNMELNSLINFAICSKSCERLVKWGSLYRKPTKLQLNYFFNTSELILTFKNGSKLFVYVDELELLEEDNSNRRFLKNQKFLEVYTEDRGYYTYWEDISTATQLFVDFLLNLFQVSIDTVVIVKPEGRDEGEFDELLNWIPSTPTLNVSTCRPFGWTEEDKYEDVDNDGEKLIRIVNTNKNIQHLELDFNSVDSQLNVDFSNTFYSNLTIRWAHWFSLQNIRQINCVELNIGESELTSEDVNEMMKMWKSGWNPSIKSIEIFNKTEFNKSEILHQLNATVVNQMEEEYEIKRESDCVIAHINLGPVTFSLSVLPISSFEPSSKIMKI